MEKIKMKTALVEIDGDEMTRIIWQQIKDIILLPFIDLKTEYFDLGLPEREKTADQVTLASAIRTRELGVAVKCATITPNAQRVEEYNLSQMWKSPNATIRAYLDGTVFRAPILTESIRPVVGNWQGAITVARHAYGDIYGGVEVKADGPCRAELVLTRPDGSQEKLLVHDFQEPGILMAMHNLDKSIESFARSCMNYALSSGQDLWFGAKDTISKIYDHRFKDIFAEVFAKEYEAKFQKANLNFYYNLIDDAVARIMRSEGGMIWALKNYDGDVMSDMLASAYGSLAMMTSVLVAPDGTMEYEAAHGTVTRHYYRHLQGEKTSTNPMATLWAWTGALKKRAELDELPRLAEFATQVEAASLATIEAGFITGDLKNLARLADPQVLDTRTFLEKIAARLA